MIEEREPRAFGKQKKRLAFVRVPSGRHIGVLRKRRSLRLGGSRARKPIPRKCSGSEA